MKYFFAMASIYLFSLAITHFTHEHQSLGNPDGRAGKSYIPGMEITEISKDELIRKENETILNFVERLNKLVHISTYKCHPKDFKFSFIEETVLYFFEKINLTIDLDQGPLEIDKFRCGLCHQRAYLLATLLNENKIKATAFGIYGHVVTAFTLNNHVVFIADPDYGVGPFEYSNDDMELRNTVTNTYKSFSKQQSIIEMYTTRENNRPYLHPDYLNEIKVKRQLLYKISDFTGYLLIILGLFCALLIFFNIRIIKR
jgi:hypothetical protein